MEKNKRNKIIGLSIGIFIVLIIVVSSTYAYWQITKTQETPNDIVAACLDLNLEDKSAAIDLDSAWPISDEEASSLTGYTFTVTNNCDEEINYIVGLNRVEESNYLQDSSIKVRLDEQSSQVYGDLSDVEYIDAENTYTSRVSKQVSVENISANGTNTHTIKVWVSSDAPVTEQSKIFQGQVFITGGQGIEVPECYTIANNGTILGYDESCGLDVKVPAEINGIKVKEINALSFNEYNVLIIRGYYGEKVYTSGAYEYENEDYIYYFVDHEVAEYYIANELKPGLCDDVNNCDFDNLLLENNISIMIGLDEYNNFNWAKYDKIYIGEGGYFDIESGTGKAFSLSINSIDLSEAIYLETINSNSFIGAGYYETSINDTCEYDSSQGAYRCYTGLSSIELPRNASLKTIGIEAFYGNNLTDLVIPSTVEVIGEWAFSINNIENLVFEDTEENPSQLTTIGESAFWDNNIKEIVIPSSVTTIEEAAFSENPNLTNVTINNSDDNVTLGYDAFPSTAQITYNPN